MIGIFLLTRKEVRAFGAIIIFVAGAFFVQAGGLVFANKIETYSQRAAIDFFIEHQNEDCYMEVWGYHSYAQYFYGLKNPPKNPAFLEAGNMVFDPNYDKPVYIVAKIGDDLMHYNHFKVIGEKNGFVFLTRVK